MPSRTIQSTRFLVAVAAFLFSLVFSLSVIGASAVMPDSISPPSVAHADELNDKKAELDGKVAAVEASIAECESNQAAVDAAQARIDELLSQIDELQAAKAKTDEEFGKYASIAYKVRIFDLVELLLSSDDFGDLMRNYDYIASCLNKVAEISREQGELVAALESEYAEVSAEKDSLDAMQAELDAKRDAIQSEVDALRGEIDELQVEAFEKSLAAFPTGDTTGWRSGPASGYGGYGDASIADNQRTATGAAVNEHSMGVAIPMAWGNTRSYYGKRVEISYNGQSVIATVNDCGGMNGGQRHLDLQPGVFKAFGFDNCNSWGVRTVKYRFLD